MLTDFSALEALVLRQPKQTVAFAAAGSEEVLLAVEHARQKGVIDAHLVGDGATIRSLCEKNSISLANYELTDIPDPKLAAAAAVELVRTGKAHLLM